MKKLILSLGALLFSLFIADMAYAGSLNEYEAAIVEAAREVYEFNGKQYKVDPVYIDQLIAYLSMDNVDLSKEDKELILQLVYDYVETGVEEGYLLPVEEPSDQSEVDSVGNGNVNNDKNENIVLKTIQDEDITPETMQEEGNRSPEPKQEKEDRTPEANQVKKDILPEVIQGEENSSPEASQVEMNTQSEAMQEAENISSEGSQEYKGISPETSREEENVLSKTSQDDKNHSTDEATSVNGIKEDSLNSSPDSITIIPESAQTNQENEELPTDSTAEAINNSITNTMMDTANIQGTETNGIIKNTDYNMNKIIIFIAAIGTLFLIGVYVTIKQIFLK